MSRAAHAPSRARPRRESVTSMGKKGVSRRRRRVRASAARRTRPPLARFRRAVLAVALAAVVGRRPPRPRHRRPRAWRASRIRSRTRSTRALRCGAQRDQQRVDFWRERLGASRGPYVPPAGCKDLYPKECAAYAQNNECVKNPGWMIVHCAVTCRSCDIRRPEVRCDRRFLNVSDVPAYSPGKMDSVFEELTTSAAFADYRPTVHLRDPWVVTLDSFLPTPRSTASSTPTGSALCDRPTRARTTLRPARQEDRLAAPHIVQRVVRRRVRARAGDPVDPPQDRRGRRHPARPLGKPPSPPLRARPVLQGASRLHRARRRDARGAARPHVLSVPVRCRRGRRDVLRKARRR